jgi:hypothetical protein
VSHTFELSFDLSSSKVEAIQDWLQLEHGPFYDYSSKFHLLGEPEFKFDTAKELLQAMGEKFTNAIVVNTIKYSGKNWSFTLRYIKLCINVAQGLSGKKLKNHNQEIYLIVEDDTMAVEFKLKFM